MRKKTSIGKVLVTGGLGFIGHHLCEALLRSNADVVIVDDQGTSVAPAEWFRGRARVELTTLSDYRIDDEFDWICHLASPVGPTRVMTAHGEVARAIVNSMAWLIDNLQQSRTRIVYVSSSEVYGVERRANENDDLIVRYPYSGRREYSCAKLMAEIMLLNATRNGRMPLPLIVRPFNVAGPRQSERGGFVLPRFASSIMADQPLTVYGSGAQRRCFTHVSDVADAVIELMKSEASGIYNIGNVQNDVSIAELAERLCAMAAKLGIRSESKIDFVDPKLLHGSDYEEAPDKIPDIAKLTAAIDWRPRYDLDALLQDVLESVAKKVAERT